MEITLILSVLGLIVTAAFPLLGYYKKRRQLYNYYSMIWKKNTEISALEILGVRPCEEYYMQREVDKLLTRRLMQNKNTLIIGQPLSGKTRAVFNAIKHIDRKLHVLMPRCVPMPVFELPKDYFFKKGKIIFIDDLQHYIEKQENYHLLFKKAQQKNIPIIAACHSGKDFRKVKNKLTEQNLIVDMFFGDGVLEMEKLSAEDGRKVAEKLGMLWDSVKFNGTIGSIFMRLSQMETRFDTCDNVEKTILRVMRNLYLCGIYEDNNIIRIAWIKRASLTQELEAKEFEWSGWMKVLEEKEFLKVIAGGKIWAEDAYLQHVIKPEAEYSRLDLFTSAIDIFYDDPEVLQMIGDRMYEIALDDAQVKDYLDSSIKAFERILELIKDTKEISRLIKVKQSLGKAYSSLSYIQDTVGNSEIAVGHFNELLALVSREANPYEYARIKMRIGNAYRVFTFIENIEESCQRSINAYNEALEIFTIEDNPLDLALTLNNLGSAYQLLAESKDHVANYRKSLDAFHEAKRVRDLTGYPEDKGFTLYNSANTYTYLSSYENTEMNLCRAIELYGEYLKSSPTSNPTGRYGGIMNNIGYAYAQLALVKEPIKNNRKAIEYLDKALEVRTMSQMPFERSETLYNLGEVYLQLSEIEDGLVNLKKAKQYLEEALGVKDIQNLYKIYSGVKYTLGNVLIRLSEEGDNSPDNFENGMKLLIEASEITKDLLPKEHDLIMKSIEKAKNISQSAENFRSQNN
ncbi:MAG: tetratricopeptide repeat protein [Ignavibacteria bacterium]|nr:tetratricopeptide repeat protein [Ignavibacteria bacterium]